MDIAGTIGRNYGIPLENFSCPAVAFIHTSLGKRYAQRYFVYSLSCKNMLSLTDPSKICFIYLRYEFFVHDRGNGCDTLPFYCTI